MPRLFQIALLTFALAACNTMNTVVPISNAAPGTPGFKQVITNSWLNSKSNVTDVKEDVVNGDQKRVQLSVYSDQATPQSISYRFEWFDGNGMRVTGAAQAWQTQRIMPRETIIITGIGPTPTATQWQLQLLDTNLPWTQ